MAGVSPEHAIPSHVLSAWQLDPATVRPLGTGLINRTFLAREHDGPWRVLQQLNPMFAASVNEDIEAVTAHLAAQGLPTPRLLRTRDGALCLPEPGGAWRLLTHVEGRVLDAIEQPAQARSAGRLLARFHRALETLAHDFRHRRPPIHEPARHLANLAIALQAHPRHRLRAAAGELAEAIFAAAEALPALPATPLRIVHGDPKISNLVFDEHGREALCMLDLDTIGQMPLPYELGDAFRSWCNVATEDAPGGSFSAERFAAAVRGYGEVARGWLSPAEASTAVLATALIQVELAARFCADSLNENYFGWNPARFGSRGEHNLVRAQSQLGVHRSLRAQWARLESMAGEALESRQG